MSIEIINKLFYIVFVLSCLNIFRITFFLIGSFVKSSDDIPQKFRLTPTQLIFLGLSIAYVVSTLFTGIGITI